MIAAISMPPALILLAVSSACVMKDSVEMVFSVKVSLRKVF